MTEQPARDLSRAEMQQRIEVLEDTLASCVEELLKVKEDFEKKFPKSKQQFESQCPYSQTTEATDDEEEDDATTDEETEDEEEQTPPPKRRRVH